MYSTPSLSDLIDTSPYQIEEKGIITPAMPLQDGVSVYRWFDYNMGDESILSLSTIIRWALLYELLSQMEYSNQEQFQLHKKNSIPFVTEWLDDLMLLNWELSYEQRDINTWTYGDFVYWNGEKLKDCPFNILKYCKHCFEEIHEPFSINSLHYFVQHEKDCSKKYYNPKRNEDFKRNFETISEVGSKLAAMMSKIEVNDVKAMHKEMGPNGFLQLDKEYIATLKVEPQEALINELNNVLGECREKLISIAQEWHSKLEAQPFYDDSSFDPTVKSTTHDDLYFPKTTSKKYKEFNAVTKNIDLKTKDIREIFEQLYSSHTKKQYDYDFIDFLRRLFLYK